MYKINNLTRENIEKFSLLISIANAIMIGFYPELSHENSWDKYNYNIQDSMGSRGTITFKDGEIVGAFRNDDEPILQGLETYLDQIPNTLKKILMEETLQYLLDEDVNGDILPCITTFFVIQYNNAVSINTDEEFHIKSGGLISIMCSDYNQVVDFLEESYEMNEIQLTLMDRIYKRKINNLELDIVLTREEIDMIGDLDDELLVFCRTAFNEIGIYFEE